jgi:serine/threonine protein kinase
MSDPPVQFGRYTLVQRLGAGGMAEVWRARVSGAGGFSRELVVKRIMGPLLKDPDFAELFAREARLSARLSHSNIVQVFEYGDVNGEPFIAMEFVDGIDLHRLARRTQRVPQGIAAYIAREMGRALKHVHEARGDDGGLLGLVHRDISPSNILLGVDGSVKLFDFGIAKTLTEAALTRTGAFRGKIAYSAPEVIEGGTHDARSDLFALGIVLHELLTGKRLFASGSDVETFAKVHAANAPLPSETVPDVSPSLEAVCMKLLARLPGDRFETAQAFLQAIDPIVHELQNGPEQLAALVTDVKNREPLPPPSPSSPPPAPHPTRSIDVVESVPASNRRALIAVAAGALVVVLAAVGWSLRPAPTPAALPVVDAGSTVALAPQPPPERVVVAPVEPEGRDASVALPAVARKLVVRSKPARVVVRIPNGAVLGTTPFERTFTDAERPRTLLFERKGLQSQSVNVGANATVIEVTLKAATGRSKSVDLRDGGVVDPFK